MARWLITLHPITRISHQLLQPQSRVRRGGLSEIFVNDLSISVNPPLLFVRNADIGCLASVIDNLLGTFQYSPTFIHTSLNPSTRFFSTVRNLFISSSAKIFIHFENFKPLSLRGTKQSQYIFNFA